MTIGIDPQGWGEGSTKDISEILNSVYRVFIPYFQDKMNSHDLLIAHSIDHPITYRLHNLILLSAHDRYWCNYAYQFAHELCHFQIPSEVPQQLRWFEESICELASYYFLPRISSLWKTDPPYPSWITYSDAFTTYVQEEKKKNEPFDLNLLTNVSVSAHLVSNEYDRGKNAFIALKLLPIFESVPDLWSSVHLLSSIPEGLSIADSLRYWYNLAPEKHHGSIQKILHVFSFEI